MNLRFIVPNSPGSGFDLTARTAAKAMEDAEIASGVEVFNLASTVGLARLVNGRGNDEPHHDDGPRRGRQHLHEPVGCHTRGHDALAKLVEESGAIIVPSNSPFQTLDDFVQAWRADPAASRRLRLVTWQTGPPAADAARADGQASTSGT